MTLGTTGSIAGQTRTLQFASTALGEILPVALPRSAASSCDALVRDFVAAWAGAEAPIRAARADDHETVAAAEIVKLAGRVYARHLDGSRRVDVQVVAMTRTGRDLVHTVEVELA